MENNKEKSDFFCFSTNSKEEDISGLLAILIMALIFNPSFGKNNQTETENRLAKIEAKTEILEKIILK